jgi:hypothetical protein
VLLGFGIERAAATVAFLVDQNMSEYRDIKNYSLWLLLAGLRAFGPVRHRAEK